MRYAERPVQIRGRLFSHDSGLTGAGGRIDTRYFRSLPRSEASSRHGVRDERPSHGIRDKGADGPGIVRPGVGSRIGAVQLAERAARASVDGYSCSPSQRSASSCSSDRTAIPRRYNTDATCTTSAPTAMALSKSIPLATPPLAANDVDTRPYRIPSQRQGLSRFRRYAEREVGRDPLLAQVDFGLQIPVEQHHAVGTGLDQPGDQVGQGRELRTDLGRQRQFTAPRTACTMSTSRCSTSAAVTSGSTARIIMLSSRPSAPASSIRRAQSSQPPSDVLLMLANSESKRPAAPAPDTAQIGLGSAVVLQQFAVMRRAGPLKLLPGGRLLGRGVEFFFEQRR